MKYYLFLHKQNDLNEYKEEFFNCLESIEQGKTPVHNEVRWAKTLLIESLPYNFFSGLFLIIGTLILNNIHIKETIKIAIILIVNSICNAFANYIFTMIKHWLRIRLCRRLEIEPTERNIAVMESLEYQSV